MDRNERSSGPEAERRWPSPPAPLPPGAGSHGMGTGEAADRRVRVGNLVFSGHDPER